MDLEMIDKGQSYKKLKKSFVIFICPFDLFNEGRHLYTFKNLCMEDKKTLLGDDTAKIFLNTESNMEDVNQKLIAFLDYVAGKKSDDSFVQKLENAIKIAKQNREWRHEYMTLLMRDQENIEKGMEIGTARGIIETGIDFGLSEEELLRRLQDKLNITIESAKEYLEKFGKQTV